MRGAAKLIRISDKPGPLERLPPELTSAEYPFYDVVAAPLARELVKALDEPVDHHS
jgi:hypothetical protein